MVVSSSAFLGWGIWFAVYKDHNCWFTVVEEFTDNLACIEQGEVGESCTAVGGEERAFLQVASGREEETRSDSRSNIAVNT